MPINNFNVGKDVTLNVITPQTGPLNIALLTRFTSKQETIETQIKGLDGITRHVRFFNGWNGSFGVERQNSALDDYFALLESNYYSGVNEQGASITETIIENAGNVTQFRYIGVLLKFDDAGDKAGDATIKQSMSFIATRRLKIA